MSNFFVSIYIVFYFYMCKINIGYKVKKMIKNRIEYNWNDFFDLSSEVNNAINKVYNLYVFNNNSVVSPENFIIIYTNLLSEIKNISESYQLEGFLDTNLILQLRKRMLIDLNLTKKERDIFHQSSICS